MGEVITVMGQDIIGMFSKLWALLGEELMELILGAVGGPQAYGAIWSSSAGLSRGCCCDATTKEVLVTIHHHTSMVDGLDGTTKQHRGHGFCHAL